MAQKGVEQGTNNNVEKPQKIYLRFCSGVARLNIPAGHIWKASTEEQWTKKENMGWYTKDEAISKFGADNVVETGSSTICNSCAKALFGRD